MVVYLRLKKGVILSILFLPVHLSLLTSAGRNPANPVHPVILMVFPIYVGAGRLLTTDFMDGHGFDFL
jgi:hypothetical protein